MPRPRRRAADWRRIRAVFLRRRHSYESSEVPELLGIEAAVVSRAIDEGTITAIRADGEVRVAWEDVVALGLEHRWTFRMLTEALRGRGGDALPPLVRAVAGRVVLPRYQWQILRLLAEQRAKTEGREITVSDLLEDAVSTAVLMKIEDWDALEQLLPGVRAAAEWPSG